MKKKQEEADEQTEVNKFKEVVEKVMNPVIRRIERRIHKAGAVNLARAGSENPLQEITNFRSEVMDPSTINDSDTEGEADEDSDSDMLEVVVSEDESDDDLSDEDLQELISDDEKSGDEEEGDEDDEMDDEMDDEATAEVVEAGGRPSPMVID